MNTPRRSFLRRVPWWLWVGFAIVLVVAVIFAVTARGQAVEEVAQGDARPSLVQHA